MPRKGSVMEIPNLDGIQEVGDFLVAVREGRVPFDKGLGGAVAVVRNIDRTMAEWLLSKSVIVNRHVRPYHVRNLADAMTAGDFYPILSTLKVSRRGEPVDGQHRLLAAQVSDVKIPAMLLVVLADDEALPYVDSDIVTRSAQDSQIIAGKEPIRPSIVGAVGLERNNFKSSLRLSHRIRGQDAESSPHLPLVQGIYKKRTATTSGVLAAAIRCARVDAKASRKFFLAVVDSDNTQALVAGVHSPEIVAYKDILNALKAEKVLGFRRQWEEAARGIMAFRSWYEGKGNKRNKLPDNGKFPAFGMDEWAQQVGQERRAAKKKDLDARVSEVCRNYKISQFARKRIAS